MMFEKKELKVIDISFNEDDRAQRLLDIFPEMSGQVNLSYINSTNHVVAWHKHEIQTDYWTCVKGSIKVGLAIPLDEELIKENRDTKMIDNCDSHFVEWYYLSDKNLKSLKIPPGVYHGYKALEPGSILLYGLTHKYNPNDEYRAEVGSFGENWNIINK